MEADFADIVNYTRAMEIEDGRGCIVGCAGIVVDLSVGIENGNFDALVACKHDAEKEARWASAHNDDLGRLVSVSIRPVEQVYIRG